MFIIERDEYTLGLSMKTRKAYYVSFDEETNDISKATRFSILDDAMSTCRKLNSFYNSFYYHYRVIRVEGVKQ